MPQQVLFEFPIYWPNFPPAKDKFGDGDECHRCVGCWKYGYTDIRNVLGLDMCEHCFKNTILQAKEIVRRTRTSDISET